MSLGIMCLIDLSLVVMSLVEKLCFRSHSSHLLHPPRNVTICGSWVKVSLDRFRFISTAQLFDVSPAGGVRITP